MCANEKSVIPIGTHWCLYIVISLVLDHKQNLDLDNTVLRVKLPNLINLSFKSLSHFKCTLLNIHFKFSTFKKSFNKKKKEKQRKYQFNDKIFILENS